LYIPRYNTISFTGIGNTSYSSRESMKNRITNRILFNLIHEKERVNWRYCSAIYTTYQI